MYILVLACQQSTFPSNLKFLSLDPAIQLFSLEENMIQILFFILVASGQLVSTFEQPNRSSADDSVKNIFILAGQSNMAGRGGVINETWDGFVPPQCQPNPLIFRLNAGLNWVQAVEPLHKDIDISKTNGIGPGMPFANTLLTKNPSFGVIGLVPCAIGGTSISQWAKEGFLYNQLLNRTAAALRGGGGRLRGILWYQGEADTQRHEDARRYRGRLEKFFTDVRADLGFPELLVIEVALASGQGPYLEEVRKAQFDTKVTNIRCLDAKGLPLGPDNLHLDAQAQVQLGTMLAEVFIQTGQ